MAVNYYAVKVGRSGPAVFTNWVACEAAVKGHKGAKYKKFNTLAEAGDYLIEVDTTPITCPIDQTSDTLIVYADGSALSNGRFEARAGAGVYFGEGDTRNQSERLLAHEPQTNQRAELFAAFLALRHAGEDQKPLEIRTDSKYVITGVTEWMFTWKWNGWKTANGGAVLHQDLWIAIDQLIQERAGKVNWRHVKGHSNEPGNDAADRLAKSAAFM